MEVPHFNTPAGGEVGEPCEYPYKLYLSRN